VVLIFTRPADVHAAAVQAYLDATGVEVRRIDISVLGTDEAPVTAYLNGGAVTGNLAGINLAQVVGVWHRHPSRLTQPDPINPDDPADMQVGTGGVLAGLPYLNHPVDTAVATLRAYPLVLAGRCGLPVPETVLTADGPADAPSPHGRPAHHRPDHHGPDHQGPDHQGPDQRGPDQRGAGHQRSDHPMQGRRTTISPMSRLTGRLIVAENQAGCQHGVDLAQQPINATGYIRLTVVDGLMFAARTNSPHPDTLHHLEQHTYQRTPTPATIAGPVRRLLGLLRLRLAVLDFAVDPQGTWWLQDINPNGAWLHIQQTTALPIAAAIATALQTTATPRQSTYTPVTAR
jgi:hypothetical protein